MPMPAIASDRLVDLHNDLTDYDTTIARQMREYLRGRPVNTAHKIFYGMIITTISILVMALGSWLGQDGAIKTSMIWLVLYYLIITFGELCLSPMGLSLVTKLSPKRIVSTVMGAWFLATAFSNYLAGFIAGFTGIEHDGGGSNGIPAPIETVGVYGEVFGKIAIAAIVSAISLFALAPLLNRWTHSDHQETND